MFKWFRKRALFKGMEEQIKGAFLYRQAKFIDIPNLLEVERDAYAGDLPWTYANFRHEIVVNSAASFLLAEIDGRIVAYIGIRVSSKAVHISNLAVAKAYQRQGIATQLIRLIEGSAKVSQYGCLSLETRKENMNAQSLYLAQGFYPKKEMPHYYEDGGPAVFMEKIID